MSDALQEAVSLNDPEAVVRALAEGRDPNAQDELGWTPLGLAALWGYEVVVRLLIEAGADVEPEAGQAPLAAAARADHNGEVRDVVVALLLEAGADPRRRDRHGESALGYCTMTASQGAVRAARLLLAAGADPDDAGTTGPTPLMQAARTGSMPMLDLLLRSGADPDRPSRDDADGPLNMARKHGHFEIEARLLASGAGVPLAVQTDLQTAVVWGDAAAIGRLAVGRADLSPLLYDAARHGDRPAVFEALIAAGADPNHRAEGEDRVSVLEAAVDAKIPASVAVLLAHGADPFRDGREGTMFATAGGNADRSTLESLLAAGVPIDAGDWEGTTALMEATHAGDLDTVRFLIQRGADVNCHDLDVHPEYRGGATALLYSVKREDIPTEIVRALLDAGAEVDAKDAAGTTALMWAAGWGSLEALRLLLARGADAHRRDAGGRSALDRVEAGSDAERESILVAAGAARTPYRGGFVVRLEDEPPER